LRRVTHDFEIILDGVMRRVLMPTPLLRLPILGNRAYRRAITDLRATLTPLLAAHRTEDVDRSDLLSALIGTRAGDGLSDTEICDQIVAFFLAGTESTAATLAWAWYLLDRHPRVAEQLHAEVDTVLGGRPAAYDDLPDLQVTGRIVTETLRLRPTSWFVTRVAGADTTLGGHPLKAGTIMVYSPYLIHHRADRYPDPERFDPDRWIPATKSPPPRDAMFPFGDGARKCIGDTFAVTEMTLALATIAGHWQLRAISDREINPALSLALRPRHLRMRVVARAPSSCSQTQHASRNRLFGSVGSEKS
jgi:cytochrome P450